jgi:hypothetical protein
MREAETIKSILSAFADRVYECVVVEECINKLVEELDNEIKRETNNYCYVGFYDIDEIEIVCGLLRAYSVILDYEIREVVKVNKLDIYWIS